MKKNPDRWLCYVSICIVTVALMCGCNCDSVQTDETVKREDITIPLSETMKLEMIWVEPGTFTMRRSDSVYYQVTLTKGYWLGKYEVTQAQYQTVMGWNPAEVPVEDYGRGENCPIFWVAWEDATNFCAMLTEIERAAGRLPEGYEYNLPTEAQWEYACRAGTTTDLNSGKNLTDENEHSETNEEDWDGDIVSHRGEITIHYNSSHSGRSKYSEMDEVGWYGGNSRGKAHPVGQKKPNAWGFYDMHGNVWEWCLDWWDPYQAFRGEAVKNPKGPLASKNFNYYGEENICVRRGGSWYTDAHGCVSGSMDRYCPHDIWWSECGFRVALVSVK